MPDRSYSIYQVADLLGATPAEVNEWIEKGWLACERPVGGGARITERGLMEFLKQRGVDVETVMAKAILRAGGGGPPPPAPPRAPEVRSLPSGQGPAAPVEAPSEGAAAEQIAEAILRDAVGRGASAIHLEPEKGGLALRLRIDGVLHDKVNFRLRLPPSAAPALIDRFKVLGKLDPSQRRRPQAGTFVVPIEGREIAFAISTVPSVHGERTVIRVRDPERLLPTLEELELPGGQCRRLRALLSEGSGLILVAAPSRRQRSLMLRALARELSGPHRSLVAMQLADGPEIPGASQLRVDAPGGASCAEAAAALDGQDADAAVVEEVRDSPTAKALVRLAGDGAMALAGVSGRSAARAVAGFSELCGEPYLLSTTLLAVVEPRTARRLCDACKRRLEDDGARLRQAGLSTEAMPLWSPAGCADCGRTGYRGTVSLAALLEIGPAMARSLRLALGAEALERLAALAGMKSPAEIAAERLRAGETSLEEVVRVLPRDRRQGWGGGGEPG